MLKFFIPFACGIFVFAAGWAGQAAELADAVPEAAAIKVIDLAPADSAEKTPVVSSVALHPSGKLLAVVGDDHLVRILDPQNGNVLSCWKLHTDWVKTSAFRPDGHVLATSGADRRIHIWDMSGQDRSRDLPERLQTVYALTYSRDGQMLAAAGFDDQVGIYNANDGRLLCEQPAPGKDIRAVFLPDGTQLAAAGRAGLVRLWDVRRCEQTANVQVSARRICAMAYSPDGKLLAVGGQQRVIRLLDTTSGKPVIDLPERPGEVLTLCFCGPNLLASAGSGNVIHLWDVAARQERCRLVGHTGSITTLAFRRNGATLISGSYDTTVRLWDIGSAGPGQGNPAGQCGAGQLRQCERATQRARLGMTAAGIAAAPRTARISTGRLTWDYSANRIRSTLFPSRTGRRPAAGVRGRGYAASSRWSRGSSYRSRPRAQCRRHVLPAARRQRFHRQPVVHQLERRGGKSSLTDIYIDTHKVSGNTPAFNVTSPVDGDVFFHTAPSSIGGTMGGVPPTVMEWSGTTTPVVTVSNDSTLLHIQFAAGDFSANGRLVLKVNVDMMQSWSGGEATRVVEGADFDGTSFEAVFSASHYQTTTFTGFFRNVYSNPQTTYGLNLPDDNYDNTSAIFTTGMPAADPPEPVFTAGELGSATQTPLPITLSGTVFDDLNADNKQETGDLGIAGVQLDAL